MRMSACILLIIMMLLGLASAISCTETVYVTVTPSPTPSPTTTPQPEFKLSDADELLDFSSLLPIRFEQIDAASEGISNKDLGLGSECGEVEVFLSEEPYQMIWAVVCIFEMSKSEQAITDAAFRSDEQVISVLEYYLKLGAAEEGIYDLSFADFHVGHPNIGDISVSGISTLGTEGFYYGFDTVWFRTDNTFVYVYSTYLSEVGRVLLEPLAERINERLLNWPLGHYIEGEAIPTSRPSPTPSHTPVPTSTGIVLFSDDFSNPSSGWDTYSDEEGSAIYHNGQLQVIDYPYGEHSENSYCHRFFRDFVLEVETKLVDGTDNNWHFILCRSDLLDNYYSFGISADGFYDIEKWVNGEQNLLKEPTRSVHIRQGYGVTNLIRIECIGNNLSLSVNGYPTAKVSDSTFISGSIALGAGTIDEFTEVAYDNFVVYAP